MQTLVFTSLLFAYYFLFYLDTNSGQRRTAHYNNDGYALLPTALNKLSMVLSDFIFVVCECYIIYFKQEI